jgi:hypothetical protein
MQVFVKVRSVTGKLVTLVAEINLFFLVTGAHPTVLKHLTLLATASFTVFRSKVIEHFLEIRIFFKNGFTQQSFVSLGIDLEIPEFFFEFQTVPADISVHMGKAFFTA